eukprot:scaffold4395_cov123-Isochrysis_galbana.AAC.8
MQAREQGAEDASDLASRPPAMLAAAGARARSKQSRASPNEAHSHQGGQCMAGRTGAAARTSPRATPCYRRRLLQVDPDRFRDSIASPQISRRRLSHCAVAGSRETTRPSQTDGWTYGTVFLQDAAVPHHHQMYVRQPIPGRQGQRASHAGRAVRYPALGNRCTIVGQDIPEQLGGARAELEARDTVRGRIGRRRHSLAAREYGGVPRVEHRRKSRGASSAAGSWPGDSGAAAIV